MERRERKQDWAEGELELGHSPQMTLASQSWNDASESAQVGGEVLGLYTLGSVSHWMWATLGRGQDVGEVTLQLRPSLKGASSQGL